ncbi:MAG: M28 family peptidase, partial [Actinobacteria bacterium]|nr:M28 family peptidase [Actinomycetota bacterium]
MTKLRKLFAVGVAGLVALSLMGGTQTVAAAAGPKFINLKKVPKPKISGAEIITGLEEFVNKFPMRHNMLPNNDAAAKFLAKEAKKYGFKAKILEFEVGSRTVKVVEALKLGKTKPDEWIAFISHYDVVAGGGFTVQGAYDDGSGTNMMRYFAKAFSKIKTNRTLAMLWFDAEENGLLASQAYAEHLKKKGQKVYAGLGFDMVGIGYPARYCICIYHGPNPADAGKALPIIDYVNFDFLKFPEGDGGAGVSAKWPLGTDPHVCSCGPNIRNSDESNFAEQGYFTLRWTGMRTAFDYPGYHQAWDTVPFMELVAGGR